MRVLDLDDDEKQLFEAKIAWLTAADPDDWHRVVQDFDWGEPLYLIDWIVRQDRCDVATALDVFWKGQPACWIEEGETSGEEPDGFSYLNKKICEYVADRVRNGGYSRSEIAFKPDTFRKKDYLDLAEEEKRFSRPNIRSHPDLIHDRDGREVDVDKSFYQRYPEEFHLSYYDEELSTALDEGKLFTPETSAKWKKLEALDQSMSQSFPAWLQGSATSNVTAPGPSRGADTPVAAAVEHGGDRSTGSPLESSHAEASRRIRALRRAAGRNAQDIQETAAGGLMTWIRRLFGR
jgi:hypothetical protein